MTCEEWRLAVQSGRGFTEDEEEEYAEHIESCIRCQAEYEEIDGILQEHFRVEREMRAFTPGRLDAFGRRLRAIVRNIPWISSN